MRMRLALAIVVTTEARPRRQIRAPLATARGEYLPGEAAYSSLARRRPQRCARKRAPRAAILVLFGRDERKLRASVRRTAGVPNVLHASGECAYPHPPAWWRAACAGGECACLRCCRGFSGANNSLVRYEMVDRLSRASGRLRGTRADVVLKVEDDARATAPRSRPCWPGPLRRLVIPRGNPRGPPPTATPRSSAQPLLKLPPAAHERRPYCDGGSGSGRADPAAPAARDAAAAGPEDVSSRRVPDAAAAWCARVASTLRPPPTRCWARAAARAPAGVAGSVS